MAAPEDTDPVPRICAFVERERLQQDTSYAAVGTRLGVTTSTAQRLCKTQEPKLDQLAILERWWHLPAGFFVRAAGYVDDVLTVDDAVHMDPSLTPVGREAVLAVYGSFVNKDRRRK